MIRKFVDNIDEITGQRASVAEETREFTEAILGAAHAVLPEARRIPRKLGGCERPAVRAALLAVLYKKREARRPCKTKHTTATWKKKKKVRAACKKVRAAIDNGIETHLEEYVAKLETRLRHRDIRGLYKHLKRTVGLGGRKTGGQRDSGPSRTRTAICCKTRGTSSGGGRGSSAICFNTKSPALQTSIVEKVQQRRKVPPLPPGARSQIGEPISLEAESTYAETLQAVRAMANWKAPGADSLPVELLKLDDPTREPVVLRYFHAILVRVWRGEEIPQG